MGSSFAGGVQNSIHSERVNAVYPWKRAALIAAKSFHLTTESPSVPWSVIPANTRQTQFNSKETPSSLWCLILSLRGKMEAGFFNVISCL
jgi:hypothetical protein